MSMPMSIGARACVYIYVSGWPTRASRRTYRYKKTYPLPHGRDKGALKVCPVVQSIISLYLWTRCTRVIYIPGENLLYIYALVCGTLREPIHFLFIDTPFNFNYPFIKCPSRLYKRDQLLYPRFNNN